VPEEIYQTLLSNKKPGNEEKVHAATLLLSKPNFHLPEEILNCSDTLEEHPKKIEN
jgi:hypothetical protein